MTRRVTTQTRIPPSQTRISPPPPATHLRNPGLRPDLTGGGRGLDFLRAGLETLGDGPMSQRVTLRVAAFNKRAISVYEAAGFTIVRTYLQPTNGGTFDFVDMELHRS